MIIYERIRSSKLKCVIKTFILLYAVLSVVMSVMLVSWLWHQQKMQRVIVLKHLCVHRGELVSTNDAVLHRIWDWVTVGRYGGHEREQGVMPMSLLHPRLLASGSRVCPSLFVIGWLL